MKATKLQEFMLGDLISELSDFNSNGGYSLLDNNVKLFDYPSYAWMVRTTDLEADEHSLNRKYVDEKAYKLLRKSALYGNELIMCKIGSAGKIYLMPNFKGKATLGRNAFLIRFNNELAIREFIFELLSTLEYKYEIENRAKGAVTKTITKDAVKSIRVKIPSINIQNEFISFVRQIDKLKFIKKINLERNPLNRKIFLKSVKSFCAAKNLLCYKKFLVQNHKLKLQYLLIHSS